MLSCTVVCAVNGLEMNSRSDGKLSLKGSSIWLCRQLLPLTDLIKANGSNVPKCQLGISLV